MYLDQKYLIFIAIFITTVLQAEPKSVCIIIPAYNEEARIPSMLGAYIPYFAQQKDLKTSFLVVANNCSDNTVPLCKAIAKKYSNVQVLDLKPGGKGFAVKEGFLHALRQQKPYDYIGFVDADMATLPQYYHDLLLQAYTCDGATASRYLKESNVYPKRPFIIKCGGKFFNWLMRKKMGLPYRDTQCGAKIFSRNTIEKVVQYMAETGWAFDLELLYLCELEGCCIKEVPTTWSDQPGSHLTVSSSIAQEFLSSISRIKERHKEKAVIRKEQKRREKNRSKKSAKLLAHGTKQHTIDMR